MSETVKSPCVGCKFAVWNKTSNGRLHPDKQGRCTWQPPVVALPYWMSDVKRAIEEKAKRQALGHGAFVYRDEVTAGRHGWQCDVREEATP